MIGFEPNQAFFGMMSDTNRRSSTSNYLRNTINYQPKALGRMMNVGVPQAFKSTLLPGVKKYGEQALGRSRKLLRMMWLQVFQMQIT